ncbi:MAG: invasion associated locus B family protein [Devosia sp.]
MILSATRALRTACLLLAVSLPLGFTTPASAQQVGERFGNWVMQCTALGANRTACSLVQTLVARETRQQVARFTLTRNAQTNVPTLVAFLPLGIDLAKPVVAQIDQQNPITLALETCVRQGCRVSLPLEGNVLGALRGGQELKVSFTVRNTQQAATLTASLEGVTAGLNAVGLAQ